MGSFIFAFIAISPSLFYIYRSFPDVEVWETSFGIFQSHYFQSVQVFYWTLFSKLGPLLLLIIWFLTCKNWWYHAIAAPIAMYIIQIGILFNDDIFAKDEIEMPYIFLISVVTLFVLYFIRKKLYNQIIKLDIRAQLNDELNMIRKEKNVSK